MEVLFEPFLWVLGYGFEVACWGEEGAGEGLVEGGDGNEH